MSLFVINNYKLLRKTGERLCYLQYAAVNMKNGEPVDIKLLKPAVIENNVAAASFIHNSHLLTQLDHPVFQKVLAGGCVDGKYFLAVEPVQLETLDALILDNFSLRKEEVVRIFTSIGAALRFAHLRGLMHGLLNPGSIHIDEECNITIADLGFSWSSPLIFAENSAQSRYLARYIPPESYHASYGIEQCDIYSLGTILYEIINGHPPFDGPSKTDIWLRHQQAAPAALKIAGTGLPDDISSFVNQALRIAGSTPFQNLGEFVDELVRIGDQENIVELFEINENVVDQVTQKRNESNAWIDRFGKIFFSDRNIIFAGAAAAMVLFILFSLLFRSTLQSDSVPAILDADVINSDTFISPPTKIADELTSKYPVLAESGHIPSDNSGTDKTAAVVTTRAEQNRKVIRLRVVSRNQPLVADVFVDSRFIGKTGTDGYLRISDLTVDRSYYLQVAKEGLLNKEVQLQVSEDTDSLVVEMM